MWPSGYNPYYDQQYGGDPYYGAYPQFLLPHKGKGKPGFDFLFKGKGAGQLPGRQMPESKLFDFFSKFWNSLKCC